MKLAGRIFTVADIAAITSTDANGVHYALRTGIIQASIRPPQGKGVNPLFSGADVFAAVVARDLRSCGLSGEVVKKATNLLYTKKADSKRRILAIQNGEASIVTVAEARKMIGDNPTTIVMDIWTNAARLVRNIEQQASVAEQRRAAVLN